MSYVLQIWDQPLPTTVCQATEFVHELVNAPGSPEVNPKFIEAARRLTAKYPFNEDSNVESENEVWSDGPLTPRRGKPLWGVGLLSDRAGEVQPFVVSVSNQLGLVVYNMQLGKVYLPGGAVLSARRGEVCAEHKKPWWKLW